MSVRTIRVGHDKIGNLLSGNDLVLCAVLLVGLIPSAASPVQNSTVSVEPAQQIDVPLSAHDIAELKAKSDSGDAAAQVKLGGAYRKGDGVAKDDELAIQWFRRAAEQGNAAAENELGTMYRLGQGVARDKVEALHWYEKAAYHGSPAGMFNLGTCYYNGDGVGSNEYTAYVWFLLAQDAGDTIAEEAVKRSESQMSKIEIADSYIQISEMYEKGNELPHDDVKGMQWLRKADYSPRGKVLLAVQLLKDPVGKQHYPEAMELCKAVASKYDPAQYCVGYLYRHGLGVGRDPAEAVKWYRKAAGINRQATLELAEMCATGEGTKVDRPEAFVMYSLAGTLGAKEAPSKALSLWQQMDKSEQKKAGQKFRDRHLDPGKVIAALRRSPKP